MESGAGSLLAAELTRVRELLRQLEAQLDQPSRNDLCKSLASSMLASVERALGIAGTNSSGSPRSESSDQAFEDRRETPKKRKALPKWTSQVRVSTGEGAEGPRDDGYSWRKYGQKVILGAKHPRGYYRCSHRNSRGCAALKQVQRSDDDWSAFDVTYRGAHTCLQSQQQYHHQDPTLLMSFRTGLSVKTQVSGAEGRDLDSPFSLPSTPVGSGLYPESHAFPYPSAVDNCSKGSLSPSFISPTASDSNYFSASPCYGGTANLPASGSEFTEIISAATSATNSPMVDFMDFMLDPVELEPDFPFDAASFFA